MQEEVPADNFPGGQQHFTTEIVTAFSHANLFLGGHKVGFNLRTPNNARGLRRHRDHRPSAYEYGPLRAGPAQSTNRGHSDDYYLTGHLLHGELKPLLATATLVSLVTRGGAHVNSWIASRVCRQFTTLRRLVSRSREPDN